MRLAAWGSYLLACSALLLIPLVGLIYIYLNQRDGAAYSLITSLDRQIPFIKGFIVPYLSWYGFLLVGSLYLAYKDRRTYYITLMQFVIGLLLCYGVYAIYQTTVPRPELTGSDWLLRMVEWVYRLDPVLLDIVGAVLVAEGVVYAVGRIRRGWLTESIAVSTQQRKFEGGLRR